MLFDAALMALHHRGGQTLQARWYRQFGILVQGSPLIGLEIPGELSQGVALQPPKNGDHCGRDKPPKDDQNAPPLALPHRGPFQLRNILFEA